MWKDIANLRMKRLEKKEVATPCTDDHQFKEENRHAWMIINLNKKLYQLENSPQFAQKLLERNVKQRKVEGEASMGN